MLSIRDRPSARGARIALGAALALVLVAPAAAAPPKCFEDWWRQRLDEARTLRGGAEALTPIREVADMGRTAADPDAVRDALDALRALPDMHPLVAGEIDGMLLGADLDRGDLAAAEARRRRLGLVTRLLIAGPFKGEDVPADLLGDLEQPASAASRWRVVETGPDGILPLHELMTPASRTSALVVFYLRVLRRTAIALRYGADDRAVLDIDGATVLAPDGQHDFSFDQHAAFVELEPGWRRVAVRVSQDDRAWNLQVRLTTPDGRAVDPAAISVEWPGDVAAVERELRAHPARWTRASGATIPDLLEQRAQRGDPRSLARVAEDLADRGIPDRKDSRAVTLARQAAEAAPGDVDVQWVRAIVDSDPARRREALEQVLKIEPSHPGALRRLAAYYLEYGRTDASLGAARRSLDACGKEDAYLQGWEAIARDARGFPAGAAADVSRLVAQSPRQVVLWERLADLLQRDGRTASARAAFEHVLALERVNARARGALMSLYASVGDADSGQRLLEQTLVLAPLDMSLRRQLVRLLLSDGRAEEALQQVRTALALSPGNPALMELQGEVLLASGDERDAAAAWKSALGAAQDPGALGDRITALTGADDTFGAEWTVSLDQARAIEASHPVEGDPPAVVLSKTVAYRVRADGLASRFNQSIMRIRRPDQAEFARSFSFSYSPTLERATVLAARLVRRDGGVTLAARADRPMLPDPEVRMWYDSRVVELSFPRLEEGDLIEIRWRITDRGPGNPVGEGYFGELWIAGDEVPVLAPRLVLDAAPEAPLAHQIVNSPAPATEKSEAREDRRLTVIELPPLPAYRSAPLAPPPTTRLPYCVVGAVPDWSTLARMYSRLVRDQAVAGPDVRDVVHQALAHAVDRRQKIRALYDWLIDNTRYVALELGIHALKPYDASSVLHRRFGDCKDKATLLLTMLREAGVDAELALVRTRDRGPLDTKIPTFADFDHAIVHIPGDELWLDGTVMHHGLGEVPAMDRDAMALLVDPGGEGGGKLVTIPEQRPEDSFVSYDEQLVLQETGDAQVSVAVTARGDDAGRERGYFRGSTRPGAVLADRLRRLHPDLSLVNADFTAVGLDDEAVRFSFRAQMQRFARPEGGALSAPLGLDTPELPLDRPAVDRRLPIELPPPFQRRMTSKISFPEGFAVRETPPNETVDSPFGRVTVQVRPGRRSVEVTVELVFLGGLVPVERVPELAAFVERAEHALSGRIILGRP